MPQIIFPRRHHLVLFAIVTLAGANYLIFFAAPSEDSFAETPAMCLQSDLGKEDEASGCNCDGKDYMSPNHPWKKSRGKMRLTDSDVKLMWFMQVGNFFSGMF